MRLLVDLASHVAGLPKITQVEKVPDFGVQVPINGKYIIPCVPGAEFPVDVNSYVLDMTGDVDGGDVSSLSFAYLLSQHPQFGRIYFNPLLTAGHVGELDDTFVVYSPWAPGESYTPRFQTGRPGILDAGQMPTHTAMLPKNDFASPARPGLIVSNEIDISTYTGGVGADEFMVYWKYLGFSETDDVRSDYGATQGRNDPAIRSVEEVDQEPTDTGVYLTTDNGTHWCSVGLLEPVAFCEKSTKFRVAFVNGSSAKVFLAHFAVLF